MDWDKFCRRVLKHGGPVIGYVYLGTDERMLAEKNRRWSHLKLSVFEVSTISGLNGSNLQLRDEEYKLVESRDSVVTYESPTKSLAYGKTSKYMLVVCSDADPNKEMLNIQCQKAVKYGLERLNAMEV
ncbi:uncharacterized protein LOC143452675 [Clavelina lepadiformis]|uniref:Profilin n=1 Tax=Clavelina lepadiformis TaxID=159417 RepID=A0ABP0GJD1_CLALP